MKMSMVQSSGTFHIHNSPPAAGLELDESSSAGAKECFVVYMAFLGKPMSIATANTP